MNCHRYLGKCCLEFLRRVTHWGRGPGVVPGKFRRFGDLRTGRGCRCTLLGNRVTTVGNRVTTVGNRVTIVGNRVTIVGNRVTIVGNRVTIVGNRVTGLGNRVPSVMSSVFEAVDALSRGTRRAGEVGPCRVDRACHACGPGTEAEANGSL